MTPPPAPSLLRDSRGHTLGTGSAEALALAEQALGEMLSFGDPPLATVLRAVDADPGWMWPHLMAAGHLLAQDDPRQEALAHPWLERAAQGAGSAPWRERQHLLALQAVAAGQWQQACLLWEDLLLACPLDVLALHWAHHWDLCRGEPTALRWRVARVLPEWDEQDPHYPFVLGLYAYGLQEANCLPQAEDAARRAVILGRQVPWAVHALTHVLEAQGRFDDGTAWLRQHQPSWAEGSTLACHLWWHMGLFRLEALDLPGVHRLMDAHLCGEAVPHAPQRVDAVSLLWRMHLLGEDVSARFAALRQAWQPGPADAGRMAWHDLHALLLWLGCGDLRAADAWLARCAEAALDPQQAGRSNHAVAREVGLPVMRALLALARGDAAAAVQGLRQTRSQWVRLGGSQVQRQLLSTSLLAAAGQAGDRPLARALLNEWREGRAPSPLWRHWAERVEGARPGP